YKCSGAGECAAPHGMIVALDQGIIDGMDIMNFSNGAGGLAYGEALARAYQAGITVVAAMGNAPVPNWKPLPAASQSNRTLAVGNGRITGERYSTSSFGWWLDVMAPGHEAMAPSWEPPWWEPFHGTSSASPMVAGTCALLASAIEDFYQDRSLHEELEALVVAGAVESIPDTALGPDKHYGHGYLNARNTIRYTDEDQFRRGRFTATGVDGDSVSLVESKPVILCTGGESLPVVSSAGDTLDDGWYPYAEVYRVTRTVSFPTQYSEDSVVVVGIGHGLPPGPFGSSGWARGDSLWFTDSLGSSYLQALLFRDRYCSAELLSGSTIRLTNYFWRFPLSETDTVWAPFDPVNPQADVRWAYTVFGKAGCASVADGSEVDRRGQVETLCVVPNPFNATAEVSCRLRASGRLEISVFDVGGRLVRTLFRGTAASGDHETTWDGLDESGRPVGSGTYFARLKAGGECRTAKITLVK
ncbi:MAG: hypothetical protein FJY88_13455, partial [Candidatus Eisenbacteria bacterium]|nr:hypothetical protein [Candidatus Eisenbacteria bacterium]